MTVRRYDPELEYERNSYGDMSAYVSMADWGEAGEYVKASDYDALVELIRENWEGRCWKGVNDNMSNRIREVLGMEPLK